MCLSSMGACQAIPLIPPRSSRPSPFPSRQHFAPHKSFNCNTYESPRKCCKQKTYNRAKLFRCNLRKTGGGPVMINQPFRRTPWLPNPRNVSSISRRPAPTRSGPLSLTDEGIGRVAMLILIYSFCVQLSTLTFNLLSLASH